MSTTDRTGCPSPVADRRFGIWVCNRRHPNERPRWIPRGEECPACGARERTHIFAQIAAERDRQDAKWGGIPGVERRDDHTYAAVLGEEFGEVCKAWLERDVEGLRRELIRTAAVAVAWLEELANGGMVPRA